ncbi:MAG: patatin-like phospholipase family protein [Kordiimonas sp.]
MNALRLIAGKTARKRIESEGLTPELVRMIVGASGGPKWLVLLGLDKFIFGDWLKNSNHQIDLVGSSIGAWRMANAAHPEADRIISKFVELYFQFKSEYGKDPETLTRRSYEFLEALFSKEDLEMLLSNAKRNLNVVTVRTKTMQSQPSKLKEGAAILASFGANSISREHLARFYERVVFYSGESVVCPSAWPDFSRTDVRLQAETFADVLMASGSIPFVANPIVDIAGAPPGVYRDGGVIDYHFDIPWQLSEGIVLYPHFYGHIVPGWFDKNKASRWAKGKTWDQMLMLAPSDEFVASLPGGRIPDRNNFADMTDKERFKYWNIVIGESEKLAEEFSECLKEPAQLMQRLETAPE